MIERSARGYLPSWKKVLAWCEDRVSTVVAVRRHRAQDVAREKIGEDVVRGQQVYVGLEDSKRTWKVCVRCQGSVVDETSMRARYEVLRAYLRKRFSACRVRVFYEAGFRGFELHDQVVGEGWECVVTPPHTVTQAKCRRQKNDRIDCRRLAANNERGDYRVCAVPPRQVREDRQRGRLSEQVQRDVTRICNRIRRTLEFHGLDRQCAAGRWTARTYLRVEQSLKALALSDSLRVVAVLLTQRPYVIGLVA